MTAVSRALSIALVAASAFVACKTSPPVVATMSTSPASPATSSPPLESRSDAGSSGASAGQVAAAPCASPCKGKPGEKLVEWLSYLAKKSNRCYDQALAVDAKLKGKVRLKVRISAEGEVCDARGEADGAMQSVADCAADTYRLSREPLPAPNGGCLDVVVPINFVPRSNDAGVTPTP